MLLDRYLDLTLDCQIFCSWHVDHNSLNKYQCQRRERGYFSEDIFYIQKQTTKGLLIIIIILLSL